MTPNAEDVLSAAHVLREVIRPLVERLEALEQITQALEQRPVGVIDAGIWTSDTTYRRGEARPSPITADSGPRNVTHVANPQTATTIGDCA
jgi:hypothetical protein